MLLKRKYISQNQTGDQRERVQGEGATTRAGLQEIEPWQDYLRRKQALKIASEAQLCPTGALYHPFRRVDHWAEA